MVFNPMWIPAAIQTAGSIAQMFGGGGSEGLSRDDQRFLADHAWKLDLRNEAFQHDLAKHGIKMRVDDAVSAGLHPLVGAGINPASGGFSASISGGSPRTSMDSRLGRVGAGLNQMGQDISRAMNATASLEEKALKAAELARIQADTAESQARAELARRQAREIGRTPPIPPLYQDVRRPDGTVMKLLSADASQAIMSDPLQMWAMSLKNALFGPNNRGLLFNLRNSMRNVLEPSGGSNTYWDRRSK